MSPFMKLSVVVPTYNRQGILARTLPTLFEQKFPEDAYEIIVVVDGSTDGTLEWLRGLRPLRQMRILTQANQGPAAARNAGLAAARGKLVLFIDDDILCESDLIHEHARAHEPGDPALYFGPVFVAPESRPGLATEWTRAFTEEYISRLSNGGKLQAPREALVEANCSVLRSTLLLSGGFDESFGAAREGAEYGFRLWKSGVPFRYLPRAKAYQIYIKSTREVVRNDAPRFGKSEVLFCRKHPDYRRTSPLAGCSRGPFWKRWARKLVVTTGAWPDLLLSPPSILAERLGFVPAVRRAGIRLLEFRQGIEMYRGALGEAGSWENLVREFGMILPVLLYHHVGPARPGTYPELTVSPKAFERHMAWLAAHGYTGIRPSDWLAWRQDGKPLPPKPVLLTFDDGYADLGEYAFPTLKRHRFGAGVFIVTSQMGGTNAWDELAGSGPHRLLTAEAIREWAAEGIEFGAHSRTHADLTTLSPEKLEREVADSQAELSEVLGHSVSAFAYPYGAFNEAVRKQVASTFDLAFSIREGLNGIASEPYSISRTMVQPGDNLVDLVSRLHWGWSPILRLRARLARLWRRKAGTES
jgi:peptidoglycan/xylan/chitin deacetylase (PgdA/CDA1 family)/GT2 family glycosyltransferase